MAGDRFVDSDKKDRAKMSDSEQSSEKNRTSHKPKVKKSSKTKQTLTIEFEYSDNGSSKSGKSIKPGKIKRFKAESDMKESSHISKPEKVNNRKSKFQTSTIEYEDIEDNKKKKVKKCMSNTESDSEGSENLSKLDSEINLKKENKDVQIKSEKTEASHGKVVQPDGVDKKEYNSHKSPVKSDSEGSKNLNKLYSEINLKKENKDVQIKSERTETNHGKVVQPDGVDEKEHNSHKLSVKNSNSSVYVPSWMKSDSDISESENSDVEKVDISPHSSAKPIHRKYSQYSKVKEEIELPACNLQDDISTILEKKKFEERIPRELLQHLRNIKVKLRHKVPIQHTIESKTGTHAPTPEEDERFSSIIPIRKGLFTPTEDQIIVQNWEEFCKSHDWDPKNVQPFLYFKQYGKYCMPSLNERRKFVQFLADGLPSRTLYSVYHRFKNLYQPHKQCRYNSNEDTYILSLFQNNTTLNRARKFADLGKILNRTRASVYRRYRILKRKQETDDNLLIM